MHSEPPLPRTQEVDNDSKASRRPRPQISQLQGKVYDSGNLGDTPSNHDIRQRNEKRRSNPSSRIPSTSNIASEPVSDALADLKQRYSSVDRSIENRADPTQSRMRISLAEHRQCENP